MKNKTIEIARGNKDLIWIHSAREIAANATLVVPTTHSVIIDTGNGIQSYEAGKHVLFSKKFGFFKQLMINLGFDKSAYNPATVYYVNKAEERTFVFEAKDLGLYLFDKFLEMPVEVQLKGLVNIKVSDAGKLIDLFGGVDSITAKTIFDRVKPIMYMEMQYAIAKLMVEKNVDIYKMPLKLKELSASLRETFVPLFDNMGVELVRFIMVSVQISEEIRNAIEKEYLEREKMNIKDSYLNAKAEKSMDLYGRKAQYFHEFGYCGLTEYEKENEVARDVRRGKVFKELGYKAPVFADPIAPLKPEAAASPAPVNIVPGFAPVPPAQPEKKEPVICPTCGELVSK